MTVLTPIDVQLGFGFEEIAIAAFGQLFQSLNAELAAKQAERAAVDQWLDDIRGRVHVATVLEPIQPNNFHLGHQPSLIDDDTPLASYPAVSVMAYRAGTSPGSGLFDHGDSLQDSLYVEVLVKAGPEDPNAPYLAAELCDKRIWRSVEAVHAALSRDRTLGGIVNGLDNPTAIVSEVFTRPEDDLNTNNNWFWQAGRVEYAVTKFSPFE